MTNTDKYGDLIWKLNYRLNGSMRYKGILIGSVTYHSGTMYSVGQSDYMDYNELEATLCFIDTLSSDEDAYLLDTSKYLKLKSKMDENPFIIYTYKNQFLERGFTSGYFFNGIKCNAYDDLVRNLIFMDVMISDEYIAQYESDGSNLEITRLANIRYR